MREEDLSQWDTLVVMSGDGLLHEVRGAGWGRSRVLRPIDKKEQQREKTQGRHSLCPALGRGQRGPGTAPGTRSSLPPSLQVVNGLMERPDWEEALKTPLCILPGGSGNALAASINYYAG